MTEKTLPYVQATGNVTKVLEKIQSASTPDRFTQDFLATVLGMPGGSAKPVIPFLKRTGFLGTDGVPTSLYTSFRNPTQRGSAAAQALRKGYAPLFEINEFAHKIKDDNELRGLIMQATGLGDSSSVVPAALGSFKALRAFADFDAKGTDGKQAEHPPKDEDEGGDGGNGSLADLNFGYTINLHLPATSDIAVFNAVFKSLREHLIR